MERLNKNMEDKIECKIYNLEGYLYVIPMDKMNDFESTSYYDREKRFENYILEDGAVLEEVTISREDLDNIMECW